MLVHLGRYMSGVNILVVDDDLRIRSLLRECLEGEGFSVQEATTERDVIAALQKKTFSLVTLDLNLGTESGLVIARAIRQTSEVPIIIVTGKDDVVDRVVGLEVGADDYITKPFHLREFLARVRAVLRRTEGHLTRNLTAAEPDPDTPSASFTFDGLTAHPDRFELLDRDGNRAELTSGDFRLLQIFLESPKRVLSRDHIMDRLNGVDWSPLDRTIDNQVARLRKKIERDPSSPRLIKTVRGIGYTLATDVTRI